MDLTKALERFRYMYPTFNLSTMSISQNIEFRLFCIKYGYDAEGYSDISSFITLLKEETERRKNVNSWTGLIVNPHYLDISELTEEVKMIRLLSESLYFIIQKTQDDARNNTNT